MQHKNNRNEFIFKLIIEFGPKMKTYISRRDKLLHYQSKNSNHATSRDIPVGTSIGDTLSSFGSISCPRAAHGSDSTWISIGILSPIEATWETRQDMELYIAYPSFDLEDKIPFIPGSNEMNVESQPNANCF